MFHARERECSYNLNNIDDSIYDFIKNGYRKYSFVNIAENLTSKGSPETGLIVTVCTTSAGAPTTGLIFKETPAISGSAITLLIKTVTFLYSLTPVRSNVSSVTTVSGLKIFGLRTC